MQVVTEIEERERIIKEEKLRQKTLEICIKIFENQSGHESMIPEDSSICDNCGRINN